MLALGAPLLPLPSCSALPLVRLLGRKAKSLLWKVQLVTENGFLAILYVSAPSWATRRRVETQTMKCEAPRVFSFVVAAQQCAFFCGIECNALGRALVKLIPPASFGSAL